MNKTHVGAVFALSFALGQAGCAAPQKRVYFDLERPIDAKSGHYEQDGQIIPADQLADALEKQPNSAPAVGRAKAFGTLGLVLGAVGGALIGWPVGQWAAGEADPLWGLAYAGLGTSAVAIAFGFGASGSLSSAVEAHNKQERFRSASPAPTTPKPRAASSARLPKSDVASPAAVPAVDSSAPASPEPAAPVDESGSAEAVAP